MNGLRFCSLLVFTAALATTVPVLAQGPPAGAPGGQPGGGAPRPAPVNLKVLPKDIATPDLIKVMMGFRGDLGVQCTFCHAAADPTTRRTDYSSDANPVKDKARVMIAMTEAINTKFLTQLNDRMSPPITVTCGTCHRGESHPSAFVAAAPPPRPAGAGPGGPGPGGAPGGAPPAGPPAARP